MLPRKTSKRCTLVYGTCVDVNLQEGKNAKRKADSPKVTDLILKKVNLLKNLYSKTELMMIIKTILVSVKCDEDIRYK